ncbi:MAG: cob(I)yrinic acid a,c-diamide adenosyltransferase [Rhodobiaceae bacterium]|nr:cob(I)yrinic acid a,c-diamide adenosyltransferase [Rhodobiaceae bacterium]MCR9242155.1 cob(I)yrinic acid a,c-diamide adenosyltransferase [Rhodobiaceae bacterium]
MSAKDENATHTEEMKKVQSAHREKMSEKKEADRGLFLILTGDGKGKSSSAFGSIIRALGWGHSVGVVQYVKGNWKTGERQFFQKYPDLVTWHTMGQGFTWDTQDREKDIEASRAAWDVSAKMLASGDYDLVVLDELNIVLRYDYLPVDEVLAGLMNRHPRTSVMVTGRDAKEELRAEADLITEMTPIKHPFESGIKAKRGIDY